jgi:putative heme iron utilization protein
MHRRGRMQIECPVSKEYGYGIKPSFVVAALLLRDRSADLSVFFSFRVAGSSNRSQIERSQKVCQFLGALFHKSSKLKKLCVMD